MKTKVLTRVGMLAILSYLLFYIEFPIMPAAPWLKLDFSLVPAMLGTFAMGPIAGVSIIVVKNLLHLVFQSTTGGVGELADFLVGMALVLPAGYIYSLKKNRVAALMGIAAGTVIMAIIGVLANLYILIPLYMGSLDAAPKNYLMAIVAPFNLIKGAAVGAITFIIYKRVSKFLHY